MRKFLVGTAVGIVSMLLVFNAFYAASTQKLIQAKKEAIAMVSQEGLLVSVQDFYLHETQATVYGLYGKNEKNEDTYVLIDKSNETAYVYAGHELKSRETIENIFLSEHLQADIRFIRLGLQENQPIWEVTYMTNKNQLNYTVYSAHTGEVIKEITISYQGIEGKYGNS